jgi:isoleucyl-tRNA synthetase
MDNYNFSLDEKVTIWKRHYIEIEANSEEEAIKIAKLMFKRGTLFDTSKETEYLFDTESDLSFHENGDVTKELIDKNGKVIDDDKPLSEKRDDKIDDILG